MEGHSQFALLKTQRFLPLFVTQAIGAFNDNALRNAVIILITFDLAHRYGWNDSILVPLGTGLFVLPYLLFSSLAGQLADKFDKAVIARRIKLIEALAMAFGAHALWADSAVYDMAVLFIAGTISAFFGPLKYGVLPQYLKRNEVIGGNALIEMGTFLTILFGTMWGGVMVLDPGSRGILCTSIIVLSVVALYAAWRMPPAPPVAPDLKIDYNIFSQTIKLIGMVREKRDCVLGRHGRIMAVVCRHRADGAVAALHQACVAWQR